MAAAGQEQMAAAASRMWRPGGPPPAAGRWAGRRLPAQPGLRAARGSRRAGTALPAQPGPAALGTRWVAEPPRAAAGARQGEPRRCERASRRASADAAGGVSIMSVVPRGCCFNRCVDLPRGSTLAKIGPFSRQRYWHNTPHFLMPTLPQTTRTKNQGVSSRHPVSGGLCHPRSGRGPVAADPE